LAAVTTSLAAARPISTPAAKSERPPAPIAAVSFARRLAIACSSFGNTNARTVAAVVLLSLAIRPD
jgi:hypothetical protein